MSKVGFMKTPVSKVSKRQPIDLKFSGSNPFDSDLETDKRAGPARTSPAPSVSKANMKDLTNSYNEDERRWGSSSSSPYSGFSSRKDVYKNDFRDLGGLENQSVQELESYAVYKSEETTRKINDCRKIAEEIREGATTTLITLHQQGEQITRSHMTAASVDHDLSRGEKLLGSLGGIFSKTWKPKKTRHIKGPVLMRDDSFKRKGSHMEQRERLGLSSSPKGQPKARQYLSEPTSALEKVEVEKAKQDDALADLSNVLGQLKEMALDMGTKIQRQSVALDPFQDDVEELGSRVKGANIRTRRLLRK